MSLLKVFITSRSNRVNVLLFFLKTQLTRKFKKKYSENAKKGGGDAPELILPETPKPENKAYVPSRFLPPFS